MSLQSSLITALANVAGGKLYAQIIPADARPPYVAYRVLAKDPLSTLDGSTQMTRYSVAFECYGRSYEEALSTAAAVSAAIASSGLTYFPEPSPGEDYIPEADEFMEPVFAGFWL